MYDFQGGGEKGVASYPKPSLLLTAAEMARLSVEYSTSLLIDALTPSRTTGEGRPVLVRYTLGGNLRGTAWPSDDDLAEALRHVVELEK